MGIGYLPIEEHGLIGNMHTAALVGINGRIDWLCLPNFDSPTVFCALLDDEIGGYFSISPTNVNGCKCKQLYWPDSNILITRFLHHDAIVEVIDYMPVGINPGQPGFHSLIRRVALIRGHLEMKMVCLPAFNYARDDHTLELLDGGHSVDFHSATCELFLHSSHDMQIDGKAAVTTFMLDEDRQSVVFSLQEMRNTTRPVQRFTCALDRDLFRSTFEYWTKWLSHCTYRGRWRHRVHRAVLAMKLMTYDPTGAIIAAPTFGLVRSS